MSNKGAIYEKKYSHCRLTTYVAIEDLDFEWGKDELYIAIELWGEGKSIFTMAQCLGRDIDEVVLLLMDLGDQELIRERDRGVLFSSPLNKDTNHTKSVRKFCNKYKQGYTVYEDANFIFDQREAIEFDGWWNQNLSIQEIANLFGRKSCNDIIFLMMDRSRKGAIKSRAITIDGRMLKKDVFKPICITN